MSISLRSILFTGLLVVGATAQAATAQNDFYTDFGVAHISNGSSNSTGIHYKVGYNYYLTPFIALDFNYSDTSTIKDPNQNTVNDDFSTSYSGFGAGLKLQHYLGKSFSVYAKGGANSLKIKETSYDANQGQFVETEESGIYPYGAVGMDVLAPMKQFKFNLNYTYQVLEDDYNASSFTVGATYQF